MTGSRAGGLLLRGVRHPLAVLLWTVILTGLLSGLAMVAVGVTQRGDGLGFSSALQALAATLSLLLVSRFVERRTPAEVGFDPRNAKRELALGVLAGLAIISLVVGILAAIGAYRAAWFPLSGRVEGLLSTVVILAFAAWTEEVIFRAVLFRHVEAWAGSGIALLLSSLVFGVAHLGNPNASWVAAVAIALEAGVLLGAVWMLTRSLWCVWGLHLAWNWSQGGFYGASVSGVRVKGVLQGELRGHPLWSGGDFGPEAGGVAVLVAGTLGALLLVHAIRRGHWRPNPWRPAWRPWERSPAPPQAPSPPG